MEPTSTAITVIATAALMKIFDNTAKAGVKNVGKAIGDVFAMFPDWTAYQRAMRKETYKYNLELLRRRLEHLKEEEVQEVAAEVSVPILEKLAYVSNEKIRDLYLNLLQKAAVKDTAGLVHPAFATLVANMAPDEALLLEYFNKVPLMAYMDILSEDIKAETKREVSRWVTLLDEKVELAFPRNLPAYLNNFCRLGVLLERRDNDPYLGLNQEYYSYLKPYFESFKEQNPAAEGFRLLWEGGWFAVTDFGKLFISACVTEENVTSLEAPDDR